MNTRWLLIAFLLAGVASFSLAFADGNGAFVIRGDDTGWIQWHWNGEAGDASVISVNSTNSEFFCDADGYDLWWTYREVYFPNGVENYHDHGFYFVRVWSMTVAEWNAYANICDLINNGEHVADGIVQATYFDNDEFNVGPGANIWGHHYAGMLSSGICEGGMVSFNLIRRAQFLPTGVGRWRVVVGPLLDCD
jgi:hypothetical protein